MGLVAAGGVELRGRDGVENRPPHFGAGEARTGQSGAGHVRVREIRLAEIHIGQRGREKVRTGKVGLMEIRACEVGGVLELAGERIIVKTKIRAD